MSSNGRNGTLEPLSPYQLYTRTRMETHRGKPFQPSVGSVAGTIEAYTADVKGNKDAEVFRLLGGDTKEGDTA